MKILFCPVLLLLLSVQALIAQDRPHFIEMFRPLYLTTGVPLTEKPTKDNADVKFQLSLEIPIWRNIGGSGIDLLAAYTQISLWNFYAHSSPFQPVLRQYLYPRALWPQGLGRRAGETATDLALGL